MKSKRKKIPLYVGNIIIIQLDENEELNSISKKYNLNYDISDYHSVAFRNNHDYYLVFNNRVNHGIIAHECLHIVSYIFIDHIIKMDCENDEPIAYLLEWLINECYKFLRV